MKLILSILILFFSQTILTKELTLLCVGDSITEGSSTHSTYRHFIDKYLDQKLTHVGPFKDKNSLKHAGRGGWSVENCPKIKNGMQTIRQTLLFCMLIITTFQIKSLFRR